MYGVVTRNAAELSWPEFDRGCYEVKDVTGRRADPVPTGVNMVSCHGDTSVSDDPGIVPVSADGDPATRDQPYFDWGYVCPTHGAYREDLLDLIEYCGTVNPDVRLDDIGFPRPEYCYCDRCQSLFHESDFDDREAWRETVVTEFVAEARDRIPGRLYVTVHPDPYPGHLRRRAGINPAALAPYVDTYMIPLYDMAYTTTYWIEVIASGFTDELAVPFNVELYAVHVDIERLVHAAEVALAYANDVYFAYDATTARDAVRRLQSS